MGLIALTFVVQPLLILLGLMSETSVDRLCYYVMVEQHLLLGCCRLTIYIANDGK